MDQLTALINNWIALAQGIIGSIGALAFLIAFMSSHKTLTIASCQV